MYVKLRIIFHYCQGLKPYTIARVLDDDGVEVTRVGVHKFIQHYSELGSINKKGGSGQPSKVTIQVKCRGG